MSRIPLPYLDFPAAKIASRARFIPWWILRLSPATSWLFDRVCDVTFLNLPASIPVAILKSELRRLILRLS